MTPEDFIKWLEEMKAANLARSDAACARLLNIEPQHLLKMKKGRVPINRRSALACRALLHRMEPYE